MAISKSIRNIKVATFDVGFLLKTTKKQTNEGRRLSLSCA
jgi:hypothetical protein